MRTFVDSSHFSHDGVDTLRLSRVTLNGSPVTNLHADRESPQRNTKMERKLSRQLFILKSPSGIHSLELAAQQLVTATRVRACGSKAHMCTRRLCHFCKALLEEAKGR